MIKIKLLLFFRQVKNTNYTFYVKTTAKLLLIVQIFFFLSSCGKYGKLKMPINENLATKQENYELHKQIEQEQNNYNDGDYFDNEFNF